MRPPAWLSTMALSVIPYPVIDPVAFYVGPFPIRWYGSLMSAALHWAGSTRAP